MTSATLTARLEMLDGDGQRALDEWLTQREWRKKHPKDCFVIMPFSKTKTRTEAEWTSFFEDFLTESLRECGYRARRSEPTQDNIVCGIVEDLAWTDLVLAVLTDFNPNVWYELGARHSLIRGGTVMICQEKQIKKLPFDLKHHGVIGYNDKALDKAGFVEELKPRLAKCRDETSDSPISDFLTQGLAYCINRALAGRRLAMETLRRFTSDVDDTAAFEAFDRLNAEWLPSQMQLTIFKDEKVLRHAWPSLWGTSALNCFKDVLRNNQPLYHEMMSDGKNIRLAGIEGYLGRVTALAYDTLAGRDWLVVVEAHLKQGNL